MIYCIIPTTPERRKRLSKLIESLRAQDFPHCVVIYENQCGGVVKALHEAIKGIHGVCLILNDDMILGRGCLKELYGKYIHAFPKLDGIAQPYEDMHRGELGVSPMLHSDLVKRYWFKGYIHNFGDTELTAIFKKKGKYIIVEEAKLTHQHFLKDKKLIDKTYIATQKEYSTDEMLFIERRKNNFLPSNKFRTRKKTLGEN